MKSPIPIGEQTELYKAVFRLVDVLLTTKAEMGANFPVAENHLLVSLQNALASYEHSVMLGRVKT
jgi:hypothetical protein